VVLMTACEMKRCHQGAQYLGRLFFRQSKACRKDRDRAFQVKPKTADVYDV
jgi:hypothetical protein